MCGRFVLVQKIETLEKRFNVVAPHGFSFEPSYNVSPGNYTPVITQENSRELQLCRFGMAPFWAKKPMYLINARTEGDHNKENVPDYHGTKGIITKPAFRKPIRSQRCLVLADAFVEGPAGEGLSKPYLVHLRNKVRPFAFAGIYDTWMDTKTGDEIVSFAIITITANALLQKIGHPRMPVILSPKREKRWLDGNAQLGDITSLLKPFPAQDMNAYPISPEIKSPRNNCRELLNPLGKPVLDEQSTPGLRTGMELHGMGARKKVKNKANDWEKRGEV